MITNKSKSFFKFSFVIFIILSGLFVSCNEYNPLTNLFENWTKIENELNNAESSPIINQKFEILQKEYKDFQSSFLYFNYLQNEEADIILKKFESALNTKNINEIRICIFQLEQFDKKQTFESNQRFIFLISIFVSLCIIISIFSYILLIRYEKKASEAKQIGLYSHFMIEGIDSERSRISREIHDTVLQDMKSLSLKFELIDSENAEKNVNLKNELLSSTSDCIKRLRGICNNLTPSEFKNTNANSNGLGLALMNLTDQFREKNNISCILKIQNSSLIDSLPIEEAINIFRIIQEALNNAANHSKATQVSIVVSCNNKENNKKFLKFYITDNGVGFKTKAHNSDDVFLTKHFGLSNMKDRAKNLGGTLNIISDIGEGTELILEVPLK